jgi:uncharacterized protein
MNAAPDRMGRTPLHYAALDDAAESVRALIDAGADVDARDQAGNTPLHFAAQEGSLAVGRILLEAGAAVDPKDQHGNTPLWRAVFNSRGDGEMITLLRRHGADPLAPNGQGITPATLAESIANYPVRRWFVDVLDAQP